MYCYELDWKGGLLGSEGPKNLVLPKKGPHSVWEGAKDMLYPPFWVFGGDMSRLLLPLRPAL